MREETANWRKMDDALTVAREAVRYALNEYGKLLGAAEVLADSGSERDRLHRASHVQVEAAKRVLWMEV